MRNLSLIIIPAALSIAHYITLHNRIKDRSIINPLRTFSAGFSIAYVFLIILPEISQLQVITNIDMFSLTVLGFATFHVLLKFIFKTRNKKKKVILPDEIHIITSGLYNFLLAFSLVELSKINIIQGLILVILVIIHTTLSEISHKETSRKKNKSLKTPVLIAATLLGGLLPIANMASTILSAILYATAAGGIIYMTMREELPEGDAGKPVVFMLGVLTFILANYLFLV